MCACAGESLTVSVRCGGRLSLLTIRKMHTPEHTRMMATVSGKDIYVYIIYIYLCIYKLYQTLALYLIDRSTPPVVGVTLNGRPEWSDVTTRSCDVSRNGFGPETTDNQQPTTNTWSRVSREWFSHKLPYIYAFDAPYLRERDISLALCVCCMTNRRNLLHAGTATWWCTPAEDNNNYLVVWS